MAKFVIYIILFSLPFLLKGQEYNYVHYNTKDGLAGATVYDISQDVDGYIWLTTEFGVSRYDGKTFSNFTTDNGLTDNEILKLLCVKNGRVWFFPFNNSFCYYYKGKIYNAEKEYKLNIQKSLSIYGELYNGDFIIVCNAKLYVLKNNGSKIFVANLDELAKKYNCSSNYMVTLFYPTIIISTIKQPYIVLDNFFFELRDSSLVYIKKVDTSNYSLYHDKKLAFHFDMDFKFSPVKNYNQRITSFTQIGNTKSFVVGSHDGCYFMDSTGVIDFTQPILKGKIISCVFVDLEYNIWFSTLGDGVYKLSSTAIKTLSKNREVFSVQKGINEIYGGTVDGKLLSLNASKVCQEDSFNNYNNNGYEKRLYCMKRDKDNSLYLGFDCYLLKKTGNQIVYSPIRPIKSIDIYDDKSLIVATNFFVFKLNKLNLAITDTLFRERGTKIVCDKKKIYIGTLKGLVEIDEHGKRTNIFDHLPILQRRITDIAKMNDGSLWISTNDTGLLHYTNGKIDLHITTADKLSSNQCRSLFIFKNHLWVGTNKGLNKIDINNVHNPIVKYSTSDGLPSDVINAINVEDSIVYVGSPAGLTHFNENSLSNSSICNLVMESVTVSDKHIDSINNLQLSYYNNNISFSYTGISFKSGGDIVYKYKLYPLDKTWKETRLTTLSFPALPSGSYQFIIYAINKFDKRSSILTIPFVIETPFWKTIWFWVLIFIVCLLSLGYLIKKRYNNIQSANDEKARISQQLAILEQNALQAQMNPHFIFNCLNSIQQFIMLNDKVKANKYLTEFANLIRNTFDNSGKKNITVAQEVNYLNRYLGLEQLRYGDAFSFKITIDETVDKDYTVLPAMLLQPFVENSLRHGIRNKKEGKGIVQIHFTIKDNSLICSVMDNGVGRKEAAKLKSFEHVEYQSKGMQLTERRIQLLNTGLKLKIKATVIDLEDELGKSLGTEVVIDIPIQ